MSDTRQAVSLEAITKQQKLTVVHTPRPMNEILIRRKEINRPALPLSGFFDCFEADQIQIIGRTECVYLETLPTEERRSHLEALMQRHPSAVIYTHGNNAGEVDIELAKKYEVPLLFTEQTTSAFSASLIAYLSLELAECITRHGVFVEVYGEGILILGDSGVGKSETAIELIKRGHRLIADDAVELKKVSGITLLGSAPLTIRHYIELRGIGVVDVRRLFGMGAVKDTEKVDMIISLEPWVNGKMYDRLGIDEEFTDILGIKIPTTTIPVKPGRNLAVIIEIAAMNNRQKRMGYNTAQEFNKKLLEYAENAANGQI